MRKAGLEELIKTLTDGSGAKKVAEWNTRRVFSRKLGKLPLPEPIVCF